MVDFSTRLKVGLDDLKGLFPPEQFYDSMISQLDGEYWCGNL